MIEGIKRRTHVKKRVDGGGELGVTHSIGELSDIVCTREIVSGVVGMSRDVNG